MGKPRKTLPPPNPDFVGFSPFTEKFMRELGFVHESVIEEASSTSPRSRARRDGLKGVKFGNEEWFSIADVKEVLVDKLKAKHDANQYHKDCAELPS